MLATWAFRTVGVTNFSKRMGQQKRVVYAANIRGRSTSVTRARPRAEDKAKAEILNTPKVAKVMIAIIGHSHGHTEVALCASAAYPCVVGSKIPPRLQPLKATIICQFADRLESCVMKDEKFAATALASSLIEQE